MKRNFIFAEVNTTNSFCFVFFFRPFYRYEIKSLKKSRNDDATIVTPPISSISGNKERLTIDWITKVIAEFRSELSELQESQSNITRRFQQRNQCAEELVELRDEFDKLKLEWNAVHLRQDNLEQAIKELQAEAIQRDDDFRRSQLQVSTFSFFFSSIFCKFCDFIQIASIKTKQANENERGQKFYV